MSTSYLSISTWEEFNMRNKTLSANGVKNNCCLFERLFKLKTIWNLFLRFRDIYVFVLCKSLYCPWFLRQTCITKETEWHLLCCYHGNILGSSLFLYKTKYPICNLSKWDRGFCSEHTWFTYCLTLPIRLLGVDDPL